MAEQKPKFNGEMEAKRSIEMKTGHILALAALARDGMEAMAEKMSSGTSIGGNEDKLGDVTMLMNCFSAKIALEQIVGGILDELNGKGALPGGTRH